MPIGPESIRKKRDQIRRARDSSRCGKKYLTHPRGKRHLNSHSVVLDLMLAE
jgi:hypothetical protein